MKKIQQRHTKANKANPVKAIIKPTTAVKNV